MIDYKMIDDLSEFPFILITGKLKSNLHLHQMRPGIIVLSRNPNA
jgi:hypothetical protein